MHDRLREKVSIIKMLKYCSHHFLESAFQCLSMHMFLGTNIDVFWKGMCVCVFCSVLVPLSSLKLTFDISVPRPESVYMYFLKTQRCMLFQHWLNEACCQSRQWRDTAQGKQVCWNQHKKKLYRTNIASFSVHSRVKKNSNTVHTQHRSD